MKTILAGSTSGLALLVPLILLAPLAASALTAEEIQSQIQSLLAQIAALEAQLPAANVDAAPTPIASNAIALHCPTLTRPLARGSRDSTTRGEVTQLQMFLADYFNINPADIVTGYFGVLTERRVKQFQAEKGLPQVGIVGPMTRVAIKNACGGKSQSTLPTNQSCLFNGQSVASGASVTAYERASVGYGNFCMSESRACVDGTLYGSYRYDTCTVQSEETRACTFGSQSITHGSSILAYEAASVPAGQTCKSQIRTCDNGNLSGSYTHALCTVATPTYSQGAYYSQASYYSQGSYYSEASYYSQGSYGGGSGTITATPSITITSPQSGATVARNAFIISYQTQNAPAGATVYATAAGPVACEGVYSFTLPSGTIAPCLNSGPPGVYTNVTVSLYSGGQRLTDASVQNITVQ